MNTTKCNGCGQDRAKGKQWFYVYTYIEPATPAAKRANLTPVDVRCPACADPALVEARKKAKAETLVIARAARKQVVKP